MCEEELKAFSALFPAYWRSIGQSLHSSWIPPLCLLPGVWYWAWGPCWSAGPIFGKKSWSMNQLGVRTSWSLPASMSVTTSNQEESQGFRQWLLYSSSFQISINPLFGHLWPSDIYGRGPHLNQLATVQTTTHSGAYCWMVNKRVTIISA